MRIALFLPVAIALSVALSTPAFAADVETPDMKRANDAFRQRESQRPPEDKSYTNTKEYQRQNTEQRRETDAAIERANKGLETLRTQPSPSPSAASAK